MKQVDLGFLNRKQLNRVINEIEMSDLSIIEMHMLRVAGEISVILEFRNEKEKDRFDIRSGNLVKYLKEAK